MANAPLKPLIRGMFLMALVAMVALLGHSAWQAILAERRRVEAIEQADKAMQEKWRLEREAADRAEQARRAQEGNLTRQTAAARTKERAELDALQAKKRPLDVGAAFGRLRRKAEGGDPDAQALMGFIFLHGMNQVLSVDPRTYGVTASTRHASALLGEDIGPRLFDTRFVAIPFVPANRAQGLYWYERAAYQGHRDAQASLAKAHVGQQTAYLGYRWALVLAKSPWPKDYVSVDGNTAASVEQSRAQLEKETEADLKAEARSQADAFKPTPEVSLTTK